MFVLPCTLALEVSGCAQVLTRAGFDEVGELLRARGETQPVKWDKGPALEPTEPKGDASPTVASSAAAGGTLDVESAVRLALAYNPTVQANFEELGIAEADLVQAGLLRNPTIAVAGLVPVMAAASPAYDLDFTKNLLDLLLRPSRQRIAGTQFAQTTLRTAGEIYALAAGVRRAYYELQGAEQLAALLREMVDAAGARAEFAERLHDAGNVSALQLANERALLEQTRADLMRAEADTIAPRENLDRLMGLSDESSSHWQVAPKLPDLPAADPALETVLALARERSLTLAAARKENAVLGEALDAAHTFRFLGDLDVGAMAHKEQAESYWVVGPVLSLQVPLFDQRQAEIARLESQARQSQARTSATVLDVTSAVRLHHRRLGSARHLVAQYREHLIPLRRQQVALSQEFYNFMLLGTFDLLAMRQAEIETYRDYVAAVRDYWIAWAELERAIGARVPTATPASPPDEPAAPGRDAHQHHHRGH